MWNPVLFQYCNGWVRTPDGYIHLLMIQSLYVSTCMSFPTITLLIWNRKSVTVTFWIINFWSEVSQEVRDLDYICFGDGMPIYIPRFLEGCFNHQAERVLGQRYSLLLLEMSLCKSRARKKMSKEELTIEEHSKHIPWSREEAVFFPGCLCI